MEEAVQIAVVMVVLGHIVVAAASHDAGVGVVFVAVEIVLAVIHAGDVVGVHDGWDDVGDFLDDDSHHLADLVLFRPRRR